MPRPPRPRAERISSGDHERKPPAAEAGGKAKAPDAEFYRLRAFEHLLDRAEMRHLFPDLCPSTATAYIILFRTTHRQNEFSDEQTDERNRVARFFAERAKTFCERAGAHFSAATRGTFFHIDTGTRWTVASRPTPTPEADSERTLVEERVTSGRLFETDPCWERIQGDLKLEILELGCCRCLYHPREHGPRVMLGLIVVGRELRPDVDVNSAVCDDVGAPEMQMEKAEAAVNQELTSERIAVGLDTSERLDELLHKCFADDEIEERKDGDTICIRTTETFRADEDDTDWSSSRENNAARIVVLAKGKACFVIVNRVFCLRLDQSLGRIACGWLPSHDSLESGMGKAMDEFVGVGVRNNKLIFSTKGGDSGIVVG